MGVGEAIHIRMKSKYPIQYTYCAKKASKSIFVTEDFYLPNHMMCPICVDEWENEDIRMKTPQK